MDVRIQTATAKLLDTLYEIEKQSFQHEAFSKREIDYLLRDYNSISLAALVNGDVVAFAIGRMEQEDGMLFGHIFTLETLSTHRRKGIAEKLLSELETLFVERGAVESRLEVREDNAAAISLYEKLGYKRVGRLEGYYGKAPGLYLKKDLSPKNPSERFAPK
jgi:ribosomal protein S18 acetylase RimI-like enzyme